MFIVVDPIVTVKCRTAIQALLLYFNSCPSVMLDSLSFTSIQYLTNIYYLDILRVLSNVMC